MIIVTRSAVFATDYVLSSQGESQVMQEVGLIFHEAHPAVVPAQGFWTSSWLTYKNLPTTEYPDIDNTISVVFGNENVGRRFKVSSSTNQGAKTPQADVIVTVDGKAHSVRGATIDTGNSGVFFM